MHGCNSPVNKKMQGCTVLYYIVLLPRVNNLVFSGVYRFAVTVWYFNDVERQQARRRYALQGISNYFYWYNVSTCIW